MYLAAKSGANKRITRKGAASKNAASNGAVRKSAAETRCRRKKQRTIGARIRDLTAGTEKKLRLGCFSRNGLLADAGADPWAGMRL